MKRLILLFVICIFTVFFTGCKGNGEKTDNSSAVGVTSDYAYTSEVTNASNESQNNDSYAESEAASSSSSASSADVSTASISVDGLSGTVTIIPPTESSTISSTESTASSSSNSSSSVTDASSDSVSSYDGYTPGYH